MPTCIWERSREHGLNLADPSERRRQVLTLFSADPALEWLRPLPPSAKMVGPVLPKPAQPLPQDLQVSSCGLHVQ